MKPTLSKSTFLALAVFLILFFLFLKPASFQKDFQVVNFAAIGNGGEDETDGDPDDSGNGGENGLPKCPTASYKQNQTELCLNRFKNSFCCYDPKTEICEFNQCKPKNKALCPTITERPEAEGLPPKEIKLELCKSLSAVDKSESELKEGEDYQCCMPGEEKCSNGQCIALCKDKGRDATEQTCYKRLSDGKVQSWCCPIEGTMPGTVKLKGLFCENEIKASYRFNYFCDSSFESTAYENGKSYSGCKETPPILKPKEITCAQNAGKYGINVLCPNGSGCPTCADGRKPRLFVIWGSIANEPVFGTLALRQCGLMDDQDHCVFVAGVKNDREFEKLLKNYSGCFEDVALFAHGCPAGLHESTKDRGADFYKLLNSKRPGTVTALSCGLLYTGSYSGAPGKIPVFVQSFCKNAVAGTIVKGSTTAIETSMSTEVPLCMADEVCYECDGKGGAIFAGDCGGIVPNSEVRNNIHDGEWKKLPLLGWAWCQDGR